MLNKAIKYGKEKRKPYKGAKAAVDSTCCNNGGCPYCESNRTHKNKKRMLSALSQEKENDILPEYDFSKAQKNLYIKS